MRTTVKKSSQIQSVDASTPTIPERASVAMTEMAENMHEGLLASALPFSRLGPKSQLRMDLIRRQQKTADQARDASQDYGLEL
ncbi:MAG: hypothetical protein ACXWZI_14825 [Mycobacterium sp.]